MLLQILAVKDNKANTFKNFFPARRIEEAVRSFSDVCNDKQSDMFKFAEDFALYHMGVFDDETGEIAPTYPPRLITLAQVCSTEHRLHYAAHSMLGECAPKEVA